MIQIKKLSHAFPSKPLLFNELDYQFQHNKGYIIYGDNGTGKTTLLKILQGLQQPQAGYIYINNLLLIDKNSLSTFIPAEPTGLFQRLTIQENITYFQNILKLSKMHIENRTEQWRALPIFDESLSTPFIKCSTGMKKIALFYILTMHKPTIILADELFESLSKQTHKFLLKIFKQEFYNQTIIITSHQNMTTDLSLFTHLYLQEGKLVS